MNLGIIFAKYQQHISLLIILLLFVCMGTFYVTEGITVKRPKFGKRLVEEPKDKDLDPCTLQIKELSKCRDAHRAKRIISELKDKL